MIRPACSDASGMLRLFVYGTLKRGYWNHDTYCRSAVSVEEATVRGRLYELPSGIPVLEVPEEDVLALGTTIPTNDTAIQDACSCAAQATEDADSGRWSLIAGELLTFADPGVELPPIDRLEGYVSGKAFTTYCRVLVPVVVAGRPTTAWCYAACGRPPVEAICLKDSQW